MGLIEGHSHAVVSFPDDAAWQLQPIFAHDQIEGFNDRKRFDWIGKLNCCAGGGKIANDAGIFITAVLGDGWFVALKTRGDPVFDHEETQKNWGKREYVLDMRGS